MFFARKKRAAALRAQVDELGRVREGLRALRLREAELREQILANTPGEYTYGDDYELRFERKKKKRFAKAALPEHILTNKAFWRWETLETLTLTPLDSTQKAARAGEISGAYAGSDIPDIPQGSAANYGRPLTPEPGMPLPAAPLDAGWDELEAAEPAAQFHWDGAPGGDGNHQNRK